MLEYNDGIISDHRGLYVNFDPNVLFGGNVADPVSAASRGFTSKNEKRVSAYLDHLEKYLLDHNIESRVHALLEQAPTLSRREVKRCYEAIDRDVTRGMVSSESKIRKKHFKYEWSVMHWIKQGTVSAIGEPAILTLKTTAPVQLLLPD